MGKIVKYKNAVERFLKGENGQRFFNFAYSFGAAIVILGALFHIIHIKYGDILLMVGMGTEVVIFCIAAFDRPGREYEWEKVFPVLDSDNPADCSDSNRSGIVVGSAYPAPTILSGDIVATMRPVDANAVCASPVASPIEGTTEAGAMSDVASQLRQLSDTAGAMNEKSAELLDGFNLIIKKSSSISDSSLNYAEQMEQLSRNISGLNAIYEIQLKSISSQLDSIERVNRGIKDIRDMYEKSAVQSAKYSEETEKLTRHIAQLNVVYENMLRAMTVNMHTSTQDSIIQNQIKHD